MSITQSPNWWRIYGQKLTQAARLDKYHTKAAYRRLVQAARATVRQTQQVMQTVAEHAHDTGTDVLVTFEAFLPRVEQVIDQAVHRIFNGEQVPAAEKTVSIFESKTQIIRRGKASKPTEFGHKVGLGEVDGGLIGQYQILDGTDGHSGSRRCNAIVSNLVTRPG